MSKHKHRYLYVHSWGIPVSGYLSKMNHLNVIFVVLVALAFAHTVASAPNIPNEDDKQETAAVILSNFDTNQLPDRTVCGMEKEKKGVVGGETADIVDFPWTVLLEYKSRQTGENAGIRCGGTLINNRFVITAAHCIMDKEFEVVSVRLGEWDTSTDPDCQKLAGNNECADKVLNINIEEEIPYQYYDVITGQNDIALLRLKNDVNYTDYVRPICLPPFNLPDPVSETHLTVTGWGATGNGTSSNIKLKKSVSMLPELRCNRKLDRGAITESQWCTGGEEGINSCQGDLGGPLMRTYEDKLNKPAQWYLEGVLTYGGGCGRPGYPTIYARMIKYTTWIINNIESDDSDGS